MVNAYDNPAQSEFISTYTPIDFSGLNSLADNMQKDFKLNSDALSSVETSTANLSDPSQQATNDWNAKVIAPINNLTQSIADGTTSLSDPSLRFKINQLTSNENSQSYKHYKDMGAANQKVQDSNQYPQDFIETYYRQNKDNNGGYALVDYDKLNNNLNGEMSKLTNDVSETLNPDGSINKYSRLTKGKIADAIFDKTSSGKYNQWGEDLIKIKTARLSNMSDDEIEKDPDNILYARNPDGSFVRNQYGDLSLNKNFNYTVKDPDEGDTKGKTHTFNNPYQYEVYQSLYSKSIDERNVLREVTRPFKGKGNNDGSEYYTPLQLVDQNINEKYASKIPKGSLGTDGVVQKGHEKEIAAFNYGLIRDNIKNDQALNKLITIGDKGAIGESVYNTDRKAGSIIDPSVPVAIAKNVDKLWTVVEAPKYTSAMMYGSGLGVPGKSKSINSSTGNGGDLLTSGDKTSTSLSGENIILTTSIGESNDASNLYLTHGVNVKIQGHTWYNGTGGVMPTFGVGYTSNGDLILGSDFGTRTKDQKGNNLGGKGCDANQFSAVVMPVLMNKVAILNQIQGNDVTTRPSGTITRVTGSKTISAGMDTSMSMQTFDSLFRNGLNGVLSGGQYLGRMQKYEQGGKNLHGDISRKEVYDVMNTTARYMSNRSKDTGGYQFKNNDAKGALEALTESGVASISVVGGKPYVTLNYQASSMYNSIENGVNLTAKIKNNALQPVDTKTSIGYGSEPGLERQ